MHLSHLSLANVRSFRSLETDFAPGLHVITGPNGSGKSNLLEAIAMLATARSLRTTNDIELISWASLKEDPLPAARLAGRVRTGVEEVQVEVVVSARPAAAPEQFQASRRFRVNGVARRASDLIGRLRVVLFSADDLTIIEGAPSLRRRYLDITISQLSPAYVRALQRYQRVLQQRNSLLRRLQERRGRPDELDFWDDELAQTGALLSAERARAVGVLNKGASERYASLATASTALELLYRPALPQSVSDLTASTADLPDQIRTALLDARARDIQAGTTRYGPHRDDIAFLMGGHAAANSASRGELRGIALALRLAEVTLSASETGDPPVLLLDDVLSELDATRRQRVLAAAFQVDQVLITSPDDDRPSADELPGARRYTVRNGVLAPV
jgi:DNA replication and repair protein RecF